MPEAWDLAAQSTLDRGNSNKARTNLGIKVTKCCFSEANEKWGCLEGHDRNQDIITMIQWVMRNRIRYQDSIPSEQSLICHHSIPTHCGWVTATTRTPSPATRHNKHHHTIDHNHESHFHNANSWDVWWSCAWGPVRKTRPRLPWSWAQQGNIRKQMAESPELVGPQFTWRNLMTNLWSSNAYIIGWCWLMWYFPIYCYQAFIPANKWKFKSEEETKKHSSTILHSLSSRGHCGNPLVSQIIAIRVLVQHCLCDQFHPSAISNHSPTGWRIHIFPSQPVITMELVTSL